MRIRVYYADTDAGGVVYYANYLRWLEMARYEFIESLGMSVAGYASEGFVFTVAHLEMDYLAPALLGDHLEIDTYVDGVRRVRFTLRHCVRRIADGKELTTACTTLACVSPEGKILALPEDLADALRSRVA